MTKKKLTGAFLASETLKTRYGKDWFSRLAGKQHKRGNTFSDPEIVAKALETRRRNKELREQDAEVPADTPTD